MRMMERRLSKNCESPSDKIYTDLQKAVRVVKQIGSLEQDTGATR